MTTVAYIRRLSNDELDRQNQQDVTIRGIDLLFEDAGGSYDGLRQAFRSLQMSDVIVVTRLSQFGLGAGSLLKFVGELRGKGCHLVALNDGIDTTDRAGWSFFQHCAALVSAEKKFARERADVEYLVVGRSRGRRGGPRRKKLLTEEQFLEAQRVVLARSHTTTMAEVARSLGISRATLYRRKVHERPTDWSKVYPELAS